MLITLCRSFSLRPHQLLIIIFRHVFQNIGWLAVKNAADLFKRGEPNGFGFTAFEYAEIGHGNADFFAQLG